MAVAIASALDHALRAAGIASVAGVSIGDPADKSTWRIDFFPGASQADKDAAAAALASFNPLDPATISAAKDADANAVDGDLMLQAVAIALWEEIQKCQVVAGPLRTKLQLLVRVKAIYRSLL